jgi:chitinase
VEQGHVIATSRWLDGNEHWASFEITITNYTSGDVRDPKISFSFRSPSKVRNNYGLIFAASDDPVSRIEGVLVAERKVVPADGGSRIFTLALQDGGSGAGSDPQLLPFEFVIDGLVADPPEDDQPPTMPEGVAVVATEARSVSLGWQPSRDDFVVAGYEVRYQSSTGAEGSVRTTRPGGTVTGLIPVTSYTFQVRAFDPSDNYSRYSASVSAETLEDLPDPGDWDAPRAPFVDYTAYPSPQLVRYMTESGCDAFFTGFIVAVPGGDKKLYWGGYPDYDATGEFGRDDIAAFRERGGTPILSFGGASNVPIEAEEENVDKIVAAYQAVMENYGATHLDFDFEGGFIHDYAGQDRHVEAISRLLREHSGMKISYTLPVDGAPGSLEGFNEGGVRLLQRLAGAGVQPSLVTGMLMEFGQTAPADAYECCVIALNGMFRQISEVWPEWGEEKVWRRIGACPMFGRHINGKVFTLDHQRRLLEFAQEKNLGAVSGWDATRDRNQGLLPECDDSNGQDLAKCTYTPQESFDFTKIIATYQRP